MKRYRIANSDFDTRAYILAIKVEDAWEPSVRHQWADIKDGIRAGLAAEFGPARLQATERNLLDMGAKPFSIVAFHNRFFEQIRVAFMCASYYPALTGACALGERILNHTLIRLRDYYKSTPEYKRIYSKNSFDDWNVPITTLESWGVLLPEAVKAFQNLKEIRNRAIHFDPSTDQNDRPLALKAVCLLSNVILHQFGSFGLQPWFIPDVDGETYLKKDSEALPFIKEVYIPNALSVGPFHTLKHGSNGFVPVDDYPYDNKEVTDEEFRDLRLQFKNGK